MILNTSVQNFQQSCGTKLVSQTKKGTHTAHMAGVTYDVEMLKALVSMLTSISAHLNFFQAAFTVVHNNRSYLLRLNFLGLLDFVTLSYLFSSLA